jgi:hypothetical protein
MIPKAQREKRQKLTIDFVIQRCIRMEDTERANKFSKFNNAILLYIKQIKHPVCKKVLSFAFEQRQLKFFLQTTQQRDQSKSADESLTMEKENHKGIVPETVLFSEYVSN